MGNTLNHPLVDFDVWLKIWNENKKGRIQNINHSFDLAIAKHDSSSIVVGLSSTNSNPTAPPTKGITRINNYTNDSNAREDVNIVASIDIIWNAILDTTTGPSATYADTIKGASEHTNEGANADGGTSKKVYTFEAVDACTNASTNTIFEDKDISFIDLISAMGEKCKLGKLDMLLKCKY